MANRDDLSIVAIVAIFGIVVVVIYLTWKSSQTVSSTPQSLKSAVDSAVEVTEHSNPEKHDYTFSEKLQITSPRAGSFSIMRTSVPMMGKLHKVTVRPTDADADDYFKLSAGGRKLIDVLYTYAASAASHEFEENESLRKGEVLTLEYYNAGTTSKNVDVTFHMII